MVEEETEDLDPASGKVRSRKRRRTTEKSRSVLMTEIGLTARHHSMQKSFLQRKIELLEFLGRMLERLETEQQRYLHRRRLALAPAPEPPQ